MAVPAYSGLFRAGAPRAVMGGAQSGVPNQPATGPAPLPPITTTNGIPDPNAVTAAQTAANNQNSQYNNAITHGSTTTPLGSQTYTSHIDPATGATVYDTNVSLAPDQQALLDMQNKQALNLGGTASGMLGTIGQSYGSPMPTSSYSWNDLNTARQQTQDALYGKQTSYLDPQYQKLQQALETRLSNQGVNEATNPDAYKLAMETFGRQRGFDYGQARDSAITGSLGEMTGNANAAGQQLQQALMLRNEPLAEYNALKGAAPVNIPQFNPAQTPLSAAPTPGANAYQSAEGQIQQQAIKSGNRNAVTSGLFGLGADILGANSSSLAGQIGSKIGGLFGLGGAAAPAVAGTAEAGAAGLGSAGAGAAGTYGSLGALGGTSAGLGTGGSLVGAGGAAEAAGAAPIVGGGATATGAAAAPASALGAGTAGVLGAAAIGAAPAILGAGTAPYRLTSGWWNTLDKQLSSGKTGNATYDANTPPDQVQYKAKVSLYQMLLNQGGDTALYGGAKGNKIPSGFMDKARQYGMLNPDGTVNRNWNPGPDPFQAALWKKAGLNPSTGRPK